MKSKLFLSVIAFCFFASFALETEARPGRRGGELVNIAHVLNSGAVGGVNDSKDLIQIMQAGITSSGFYALQRMADGCAYGSESEQAQCLRFGILKFFTEDRFKVRPRRAFTILREGCVASATWKGEANCFDWGTLAIKGRVFERTKHCRSLRESQAKSYCYRDAIL